MNYSSNRTACLSARYLFWGFLLLSLIGLQQRAFAQAVFGSEAELLDGARNVYAQKPHEDEYRVVKSSIKKVNNQWRANEERLFGRVSRNTWVLKDSMSYTEARNRVREILAGNPELDTVYRCHGLDCGSSNGLANQFLRIKQLYGLDEYQYYAVLEQKSRTGQRNVHVIYLVQRGNKRIYLQHDHIQVDSTDDEQRLAPEQIRDLVAQYGTVRLASIEVEPGTEVAQERDLAWIAEIMRANRDWVLRCVGHNFDSVSLKERIDRSQAVAEKLKRQLLASGVPLAQITAHGVGSLAPTGGTHPHVELLVEKKD